MIENKTVENMINEIIDDNKSKIDVESENNEKIYALHEGHIKDDCVIVTRHLGTLDNIIKYMWDKTSENFVRVLDIKERKYISGLPRGVYDADIVIWGIHKDKDSLYSCHYYDNIENLNEYKLYNDDFQEEFSKNQFFPFVLSTYDKFIMSVKRGYRDNDYYEGDDYYEDDYDEFED